MVAGLLAAPLLIALARFDDLYFFVFYERYDSFREYWEASMTAVSRPVLLIGFVGLVGVFLLGPSCGRVASSRLRRSPMSHLRCS